jgi:hypothetical protein
MEKEMEELYIEGVAIYGGPEPCAVARKGGGEASVGVRVGWAIEPEIGAVEHIRDHQAEISAVREHGAKLVTLAAEERRANRGPRVTQCKVTGRALGFRGPRTTSMEERRTG